MKLFKPIDKKKQFCGVLESFTESKLILNINDNKNIFERKNISQIKTIYKW